MDYGRLLILWILMCPFTAEAQVGYTFNRITTEDGFGLGSNSITSLYQDPKGFMWVGTNNGLQRFDGSKFIQFGQNLSGSDLMPYNQVSNIIPVDDGSMVLAFLNIHEFGLFDPTTFLYKKIKLNLRKAPWLRADYKLWRDTDGEIFLAISRYGLMRYNKKTNGFDDDTHFNLPKGFTISLTGLFEDTLKKQYWLA